MSDRCFSGTGLLPVAEVKEVIKQLLQANMRNEQTASIGRSSELVQKKLHS